MLNKFLGSTIRFLGFFIGIALLSSTPVNAKIVTTGQISYKQADTVFNTEIKVNLKNSSTQYSVINYYTIMLPYQGVTEIKASMKNRGVTFTSYKQKDGMEVIINLNSLVLTPKESRDLYISFKSNSLVSNDWGYTKLPARIDGLKINEILFEYDVNKPKASNITGAKLTEVGNNKYSINSITTSPITLNFGSPITYKYEFNKQYINESDENVIYEVPIPHSSANQTFIIESITPSPNEKSIDNEGNIILSYVLAPKNQIVVNIQGYIVKNINDINEEYSTYHLKSEGFWNITNSFERLRLKEYLSSNKVEISPHTLNRYVLSRLTPQATANARSSNSFENSQRAGADSAIVRKDFAIAEDYVDLLVALLRDNSIPARMVIGYLPSSHPNVDQGAFHSWVQYYDLEEKVWRNLDPSLQDILKIDKYDADNDNSVVLLIRGESYLTPKLPFLLPENMRVTPIGSTVDFKFQVEQSVNTLTNNGNIPVVISNGVNKTVILNTESYTSNVTGTLVASSLIGDEKEFGIEISQIIQNKNINILSELTLLLAFLLSILVLNTIYVRIKGNVK